MTVYVNAVAIEVVEGASVAAAVELATVSGPAVYRESVTGDKRAALCGMGVCKECRVTIDGCAHQLACMTRCVPQMSIMTNGG